MPLISSLYWFRFVVDLRKHDIILVSRSANIVSEYTAFIGVDQETKCPVSVGKEQVEEKVKTFSYDDVCITFVCL